MTKAELAQEMAQELGEDYSDLEVQTQFLDWTQEAYDQVSIEGRWGEQNSEYDFSTSASTRVYSVPANLAEIRSISIVGTTGTIAYTPVERIVGLGNNLDTEGTPQAWYNESFDSDDGERNVGLWPVPDGEYSLKLHGLLRPEELTTTSRIPLPREVILAMRQAIRMRSYQADNNLEMYQASAQEYLRAIGLANARYGGAPRPGSSLRIKQTKRVDQNPVNS